MSNLFKSTEKPTPPPTAPYDPADPDQIPLPPDSRPQPGTPVREPDPPEPITDPQPPEPTRLLV